LWKEKHYTVSQFKKFLTETGVAVD